MQGELQEEGRRSGELVFKEDKFVLQDERSSGVGQGDGCIAAWMCITTLDSVTSKWLSGELYLCVLGWPKSSFGFFSPTPPTPLQLIENLV